MLDWESRNSHMTLPMRKISVDVYHGVVVHSLAAKVK
jgi:hypothetical protein